MGWLPSIPTMEVDLRHQVPAVVIAMGAGAIALQGARYAYESYNHQQARADKRATFDMARKTAGSQGLLPMDHLKRQVEEDRAIIEKKVESLKAQYIERTEMESNLKSKILSTCGGGYARKVGTILFGAKYLGKTTLLHRVLGSLADENYHFVVVEAVGDSLDGVIENVRRGFGGAATSEFKQILTEYRTSQCADTDLILVLLLSKITTGVFASLVKYLRDLVPFVMELSCPFELPTSEAKRLHFVNAEPFTEEETARLVGLFQVENGAAVVEEKEEYFSASQGFPGFLVDYLMAGSVTESRNARLCASELSRDRDDDVDLLREAVYAAERFNQELVSGPNVQHLEPPFVEVLTLGSQLLCGMFDPEVRAVVMRMAAERE